MLSEQAGLGGERWPSEKVTPSFMVISCFYTNEFESNRNMALINSFFFFLPLFSHSFDDCVQGIRDWLKQMDLSLKAEPVLGGESQQGAPDTTEELERMEQLHKELTERRFVYEGVCGHMLYMSQHKLLNIQNNNISISFVRESIEQLCQEAQALSEAGRGSGGEVRVTGQLQMEHQALLKAARERLRGCQESQAFGDTLQGVWAWLEEIQERLGTVDSTMGTKEQLEQRLETVQVRGQQDYICMYSLFR